jgi:hypothetical protein
MTDIDERLCYILLGNSESPHPYYSDEGWRSVAGKAFREFFSALKRARDSRESQIKLEMSVLAGYVFSKANISDRSVYLTNDRELALATVACRRDDIVCVLFGGRTLYVLRHENGEDDDNPRYSLLGPAFIDGYCDGEAMYDGNFINRVTLAVTKLVNGDYVDIENLDGRRRYSPSQVECDKGRLTGRQADLGAKVRGYLLREMGVTPQEYQGLAHAERLDVIQKAIQGPKEIMAIAEWRKDWWEFMEELINAYLVPEPKWMGKQKEYRIK